MWIARCDPVKGEHLAAGLQADDSRITGFRYERLRRSWRSRIIASMGSHAHGPLKFGVLGPLEVLRDGEPVQLGGKRQRALLALLLVHANELVTVDQLIDGLSGEQRSQSAVNAMRVAVSRLRRSLENGDSDDVLRTAPGGYVLCTDPDQLDVSLFEGLLEEGLQLLVVGDHQSAAARLRAGLGLWRGPALADLSLLEFLQPEIRRLEELRLLAVMGRIDAELGLGAAGELIGELELLVASNPLQERLRGQLMRALYRAGRQADALTVYRQTSELMRDELGLEPSRELRELERSILQQHAELEPALRHRHRWATSQCRPHRSSAALVSWPSSPRFSADPIYGC